MRPVVLLIIAAILMGATPVATAATDSINDLIGDASWLATHHRPPSPIDDETSRIQVHLSFVLEHLRSRAVANLSPDARARRRAALVHLERYIARGVFPRRTSDHYLGRRPRFIDDRGVYCAVGQLIASSGAPALARAIADAHEYAYVLEIEMPQLQAWASSHGFAPAELMMIQPAYGPGPNSADKRAAIARASDRITLECGRMHLAPSAVVIRLTGDQLGNMTITTKSKDPFARCYVQKAAIAAQGRGEVGDKPQVYDVELRIPLTSPQVQLEQRVAAELQLQPANKQGQLARMIDGEPASNRCWPRPGALAREASILVSATRTSLDVRVATVPTNTAINACIERNLRSQLGEFGPGVWSLRVERKRTLSPIVTVAQLQEHLTSFAPMVARERCYQPATPAQVKVTVTGHRGDPRFAIAVDTQDKTLAACVADNLHLFLEPQFSIWHRLPDGTHKPYFRIDDDVRTEATVMFENLKSYEERVTRAHSKQP